MSDGTFCHLFDPVVMKIKGCYWMGALWCAVACVAQAEPSAEFRAYVEGLAIEGVSNGRPQKIYLSGRKVFRAGEMLDAVRGVRFFALDISKHEAIFEDRAGERLAVDYRRRPLLGPKQ